MIVRFKVNLAQVNKVVNLNNNYCSLNNLKNNKKMITLKMNSRLMNLYLISDRSIQCYI